MVRELELMKLEFYLSMEDVCNYSQEELEIMKEVKNSEKMRKRSSDLFKDFELLRSYEERLLEEIYLKRKQFKYSSIVVMLYAALEQNLVTLYESVANCKFKMPENLSKSNAPIKKDPPKINCVLDELEKFGIYFEGNAEILRLLRNKINHGNFKFKDAKKALAVKLDNSPYAGLKSRELIEQLIKEVRYVFVSNANLAKSN